MAENNFNSVVSSLLKGLDGFATAKTVVGDPVTVGETILLPLVDISFAVGAGAALSEEKKKNSGGGAIGGKMSPSAVLVIQDGSTRLVNLKSQDIAGKALDMVPYLFDRFIKKEGKEPLDEAVEEEIQRMRNIQE